MADEEDILANTMSVDDYFDELITLLYYTSPLSTDSKLTSSKSKIRCNQFFAFLNPQLSTKHPTPIDYVEIEDSMKSMLRICQLSILKSKIGLRRIIIST